MWTMDAHVITVVEMEENFLKDLDKQIEILKVRHLESILGRKIESLCRDMKMPIPELTDQYYDLAYCEDVLYSLAIQEGQDAVDRGIKQMIRVVKQNGFIVAVEPRYGVEFKIRKSKSAVLPITVPVPLNEPEDMSDLFSSKGLIRLESTNCPPF